MDRLTALREDRPVRHLPQLLGRRLRVEEGDADV